MKVLVIGPDSHHYKGGIAQFTTRLCDELRLNAEVFHESWYRMYPPFLTNRNFKDTVSQSKTGKNLSRNKLDYINPFTWISFIYSTYRLSPDKIIFTWIHPVHAPINALFLVFLKIFTNSEITLLCHNVFPHERIAFQKALTWPIFKLVHRVLVHGSSEAALAESMVDKERVIVLYHPLFDIIANHKKTSTYSPPALLKLLFFGAIRPYKGVSLLLHAVAKLVNNDIKLKLTIAGEIFDSNDAPIESLVGKLELTDVVRTRLEYIPNEDIAALFQDCDAAIYPYLSATQSGSLAMSYAFGVPVIATNVGGLRDVVVDSESGYLTEPTIEGIANGIKRFIKAPIPSSKVTAFATANLSWGKYAKTILNYPNLQK